VLRGAAKTATIAAAETGVETLQDATSFAVQDIAAALTQDIPDVEWGSVLSESWANSPEIFVTMLPLAILGAAGGLSAESRAAAFAQSSPLERRALGITEKASAAIDAAALKGPATLTATVQEAWNTRAPDSPEAISAIEEQKASRASQAAAAAELERIGYAAPRFVMTSDGIAVLDGKTGEELGQAPDLSGAIRIARAHTVALDDMTAEQVAALGSLMEAARAAVELDPSSAVDIGFGETFDPEKASPAMAARFAAQVALKEQAEGGTGDIARSVLGYSVTEFAQGMRTTINKLFRGAAVTDVFHETFHGLRRQAHAAGTITRADEIAVLRALDTVLAGKRTKDGTALRFIPENMTDDQVSDTLIDEAISEIAEMELLRTRKGKGKGKLGVTRGVIARNLTAMAKLAPGAVKTFKSFIDAVRARWGLSLSRAIALKKAERDGKFDAAGYDEFLNKLLGLDAQEEHDAGVMQELDRILAMPEDLADDDIPFSIGRTTVIPSAETRPFPGAEGSPSVIGPAAFSISAFHGTPHLVDEFTTERMGTGEGAQVYGWGLYFASKRSVAEWYRRNLSQPMDRVETVWDDPVYVRTNNGWMAESGNGQPLGYDSVEARALDAFAGIQPLDGLDADAAAIMDDMVRVVDPGNLYTVELDFDEQELLDWDALLEEQPPGVLEKLDATDWFQFAKDQLEDLADNPTGADLYRWIKDDQSPQEASEQLAAAGIPGIRFLDGSSRGAGEGSRNYVVFEDSSIEITDHAFSLGPAQVADIMAGDALARVKDPVRRAQAMSRMARDFNSLRLETERALLLSKVKRGKAELKREASLMEEMLSEQYENEAYARHMGVLSVDDLTKIKSQPVHAYLADPASNLRGRVMSKAAAMKRHPDLFQVSRAGDYDGADGVSRSVFGGQLMPDQAAQELFDNRLIKSPTPAAMWESLLQEQSTVSTMKEALAKAKEDIRSAKERAKQEANDWLAQQTGDQASNFSQKEQIIRGLRMLDAILLALPPEVRGRLGGATQMARIATDDSRLDFLKDKLAAADAELEKYLREQFGKEFEALLKRTKPERDEAGKKPKGKLGANVHDLFRAVEESMGLDGRGVLMMVAEREAVLNDPDANLTAEEETHLQNEIGMINLAGNWTKADAARREAALLEGTRLYFGGYMAAQIEAAAKRQARKSRRGDLKAATGKAGKRMERITKEIETSGTKIGRAKETVLSLFSFPQLVQTIFGENSDTARMLMEWERRASMAKDDAIQATMDGLDAVFTHLAGTAYKGEELRWKLAERGKVKVKLSTGEETFSEMEAITVTLMWMQEDGKRHMEGHFDEAGNPVGEWHWTQADVDAVESQLSQEALMLRFHLMDEYAKEYDRLNVVFRSLYGVNMPRHKLYSPISVKPVQVQGGQMSDPVSGAMTGPGLTPGSLRTRSQTAVAEPDFKDASQLFIAHSKQMEHWMAYAQFTTEAMAVLNSREVGNSVQAKAGPEALSVLRGWVDFFAQGGTRDASAHLAGNKFLNRILGRLSSAALVGRMGVLVIQSTQLGAAAYEMPVGTYLKQLGKLMTGQLDWSGARQSEYIQRRLKLMPPVVRAAMEGLMSSKPNRVKHAAREMGKLISGADALFTSGTFAMVYDWQLSQNGGDSAAALAEAERITDRVAQPIRSGERSLFENTSTNPAVRVLWAFASESRQKLAINAYALMNKPPGEKAKTLAVTWALSGIAATVIRAIMRDLRSDEDEEWLDEKNWNPTRIGLMALTGPLGGFPIVGKEIEAAIFSAAGIWSPNGSLLNAPAKAAQTITDFPGYFDGDKDFSDALRDAETILTGAAPVSDTAAAAASFSHVVRDVFGLMDNFIDLP